MSRQFYQESFRVLLCFSPPPHKIDYRKFSPMTRSRERKNQSTICKIRMMSEKNFDNRFCGGGGGGGEKQRSATRFLFPASYKTLPNYLSKTHNFYILSFNFVIYPRFQSLRLKYISVSTNGRLSLFSPTLSFPLQIVPLELAFVYKKSADRCKFTTTRKICLFSSGNLAITSTIKNVINNLSWIRM